MWQDHALTAAAPVALPLLVGDTPRCAVLCPVHALLQVLDPELTHVYRDMTLGHYLDSKGYSTAFKYNYVLPMCAAVWSVPNATVGMAAACRKHITSCACACASQLTPGQPLLCLMLRPLEISMQGDC